MGSVIVDNNAILRMSFFAPTEEAAGDAISFHGPPALNFSLGHRKRAPIPLLLRRMIIEGAIGNHNRCGILLLLGDISRTMPSVAVGVEASGIIVVAKI